MSILRFKNKINNWAKNALFVFKTVKNDDVFPLAEGDLISVHLQFLQIEPAPFVYQQDMSEAIWIAELFPDGEYVEEEGVMLSKVVRISDNSTHTLHAPIDKDNLLVGYRNIQDDSEFPFDRSDIIVIRLSVTDIKHELSIEADMSTWTTYLVPAGKIVSDTIVCEVERVG